VLSKKSTTQKIYIVDDDDSLRRALGRLIGSARFDFETFASGEAFLQCLPANAQGCVILDIRMPGLTGHDVQKKLRARGHNIPVIALSAQEDVEAQRRARELGAIVFLQKPVDNQRLFDAIQLALTQQSGGTCDGCSK
jgi:FixJ family two-component response regulator